MKSILLTLFLIAGAACSMPQAKPKYELEVVTVEELAAQAVNESPTDFVVSGSDESVAWERSHLFFSTYTSGVEEQEFDYPKPGISLVSRSRDKDKYIYEIEHTATASGYRYVVSCSRNSSKKGGSDFQARRNAKNVARFIRDGNLELTLLDR